MTEKKSLKKDRRVHGRRKIDCPMRYRLLRDAEGPARMAQAVNLSPISVLFKVKESLPLGAEIAAELILPSSPEPLQVGGWINRVESEEEGKEFRTSMVFNIIAPEDRRLLMQYLDLIDVEKIMRMAVDLNASDIHLIADRAPVLRIEGKLSYMHLPPITADDLKQIIYNMLNDKQRRAFEKNMELDFSYSIDDGTRFRVNLHLDKGRISAAMRLIPHEIRNIEQLGLPAAVHEFCRKGKGLVVVTGPTGSGKSTTLAAMIDAINQNRNCMVISIEDPIEYVHEGKKCIIKQREVGADTLSFHNALKHVLRQDPDVILIGEIRDLESISIAITAAETGHLVLTTLHTSSASECINRIVDVYPSEQQTQVRSQLAGCLEGIVTQLLFPRKDEKGRVLATEVMTATPAVRNLIREGKLGQLNTYIEAGNKYGMHTMDSSLADLVARNLLHEELAMGFVKDPQVLRNPLLARHR
ncbi:MAG: type IV pilus twitching motility protein PilT [Planctomycetota bacterium]|jgi:twitching motility protein PilT